jgi:hypothetical protein
MFRAGAERAAPHNDPLEGIEKPVKKAAVFTTRLYL